MGKCQPKDISGTSRHMRDAKRCVETENPASTNGREMDDDRMKI